MLLTILILLIVLYLIATLYLAGPDLSMYDNPTGQWFNEHDDDAAATQRFLAILREARKAALDGGSLKQGFKSARKMADELSDNLVTDTEFHPIKVNNIDCEWAIRKDSDHSKRVLFLHGGGFILGSPKGHRAFSDQLAKITNGVILSVDYRLLPENGRHASIEDSQSAYQWILDNGPDAAGKVDKLLVSGDSAGGNLALMLSGWSRNKAARTPDAVVAFSPNTDMTMVSPTLKRNQKTDKLLGQGLGLLAKLPTSFQLLLSSILLRCNPSNPLVSPLFQDLSNLPSTLIHASSSEVLLGDSIRYTNKAQVSGSDVSLQVWENQIHDWHLFNMGYGSANSAWSEVEKFLSDKLND